MICCVKKRHFRPYPIWRIIHLAFSGRNYNPKKGPGPMGSVAPLPRPADLVSEVLIRPRVSRIRSIGHHIRSLGSSLHPVSFRASYAHFMPFFSYYTGVILTAKTSSRCSSSSPVFFTLRDTWLMPSVQFAAFCWGADAPWLPRFAWLGR